jgi:hypothetical protein
VTAREGELTSGAFAFGFALPFFAAAAFFPFNLTSPTSLDEKSSRSDPDDSSESSFDLPLPLPLDLPLAFFAPGL